MLARISLAAKIRIREMLDKAIARLRDGLSVLVIGIWSGIGAAAIAMMAGLFYICIWNLIAVRREMADKGQEYPFLPFLTVGYLSWCAACLLLSVTHV